MKKIKISALMLESSVQFGTSGVRGLVANMTDELCYYYAFAFAKSLNLQANNDVAIAIDLRPSSPRIANACALALSKLGIKIHYFGSIPTPALAYFSEQNKMAAIMVTGSHIPFDRNGIKFYSPEGEITKSHESAITNTELEIELPIFENIIPPVNKAAEEAYVDRYISFFPQNYFTDLTIGFYQHSSVARDLLVTILKNLGAKVIPLGRTNQFVPIDTEAVAIIDVARAKTWASEHSFDAIISTDGDADRPLIGDEKGHWLRGDIVGLLTSEYLAIDCISTPVSCNTAIEKSGFFKNVKRTRIGSPYVIEGILQLKQEGNQKVAGFEANGGYLLGTDISSSTSTIKQLCTRDAVLPILAILALAKENKCLISELINHLPARATASNRIQVFSAEKSNAYIKHFIDHPKDLATFLKNDFGHYHSIDTTDGLRIFLNNDDIIHFRLSGNAPELRCYAESNTKAHAERIVDTALQLFKSYKI